jgi:hypothetical protein
MLSGLCAYAEISTILAQIFRKLHTVIRNPKECLSAPVLFLFLTANWFLILIGEVIRRLAYLAAGRFVSGLLF